MEGAPLHGRKVADLDEVIDAEVDSFVSILVRSIELIAGWPQLILNRSLRE